MVNVVKKVKDMLTQNIGSAAADMTLDSLLFEDLGLGEAQVMELMSALADDPQLNLTTPQAPGPGPRTIADVVNRLEVRRAH